MNITILGHYDIPSLFALNRVVQLLPEHDYSVCLSGERQVPTESPLAELDRFDRDLCDRFMQGDIAPAVAVALQAPNRITLDNCNSTEGLAALESLAPDLIVSIRYRCILKEAAIAIPRNGVLNLHSGILPDYRGVMATFWAMLAGEAEIGTTLHRIVDSGIDTGPVIAIQRQALRPAASYLANVLGLYTEGCNAIAESVRAVAIGEPLVATKQPRGGAYFPAPGGPDIDSFKRKGLRLFDGREATLIAR